jgi:hypothetical protein
MTKKALLLLACIAVLAGCGSSGRTAGGSSSNPTTSSPPPLPPPPAGKGGVTRAQIAHDEERITFYGGRVFRPSKKLANEARAKMFAATRRFLADLQRWDVFPGYKIREIDTMLVATQGTPCPRCHAALREARNVYNR